MKSIHKILFIWGNYYLSKKYNIDIINDMKRDTDWFNKRETKTNRYFDKYQIERNLNL